MAYVEALTCHSKQEVAIRVPRKWKLPQAGIFKYSVDAAVVVVIRDGVC